MSKYILFCLLFSANIFHGASDNLEEGLLIMQSEKYIDDLYERGIRAEDKGCDIINEAAEYFWSFGCTRDKTDSEIVRLWCKHPSFKEFEAHLNFEINLIARKLTDWERKKSKYLIKALDNREQIIASHNPVAVDCINLLHSAQESYGKHFPGDEVVYLGL